MKRGARFSVGVSWPLLLLFACESGGGGGPATMFSGGASALGGAAAALGGGASTSSGGEGTTSGGTSGTGGAGASGGTLGSLGGTGTTGGQPDAGGGGGSSSGGAPATGKFTVTQELASETNPDAPTTVGIIKWSLEGQVPTNARIEFGLTTEYGFVAPVDLAAEEFRTLLLGMKPESTYHFRVVAVVNGAEIASEDYMIDTGAAPTNVSIMSFDVVTEADREPGFIVSSYWQGTQKGMVFILDQDGDIVWWYNSQISGGVAKAAISMDGNDMWMVSASNMGEPLRRVGIDGSEPETYDDAIGSHDIQPVEGDKMVFIEYGETDCDSAFEINKSGEMKEVLELEEFTPKGACHANGIGYNKSKKAYSMSSLDTDVFMWPDGEVGTVANTTRLTTTAGAISTWGGIQHGVHLLNTNHLLIFANKEGGSMGPSTVIEYALDSGDEVWRYEGDEYTANLGDVQRLPSGNTLVTYSNAGLIHEVTPDKRKVLEVTGQKNLGYATWRASLYGESPDSLE
jgi:hypothetical protein